MTVSASQQSKTSVGWRNYALELEKDKAELEREIDVLLARISRLTTALRDAKDA